MFLLSFLFRGSSRPLLADLWLRPHGEESEMAGEGDWKIYVVYGKVHGNFLSVYRVAGSRVVGLRVEKPSILRSTPLIVFS